MQARTHCDNLPTPAFCRGRFFPWLILLGAVAIPTTVLAVVKEYEVKATFVFRFAQFVQWPDSAFSGPAAPITIGVLGEDPFGSSLDDLVKGETIGKRQLVIKRSRQLDELKSCQILFVSNSEAGKINQILADMRDSSCLVVGESLDFARNGGVINFYLDKDKVRFEINLGAAASHNLKLSSQLIRLGKIVG